jgi:hypothetical protein
MTAIVGSLSTSRHTENDPEAVILRSGSRERSFEKVDFQNEFGCQ